MRTGSVALVGALATVAVVGAAPGVALAGTTVRVAHNVPRWVQRARPTGHAATGKVTVSVYLKLRDQAKLERLNAELYRPGSDRFRRFLTPAQFRARFAPTAADLAAVRRFLAAKGLTLGATPANRTYVDATASVRRVERAFGVRIGLYRYRGLTLRATRQAPRVSRRLARIVRYVGGLDDTERLIRPANDLPGASPGPGYATPGPCSTFWGDTTGTATPAAFQYGATLPWTPCGYVPAQIRAAYGVDRTSFTGKGVTVGITDAFASPTIRDDVNRFSAHYGLPPLTNDNFVELVKPGTYNYPENHFDPQGWYGEESLDVEWVHAMAPNAKIVFAGGQNSTQPLDHALIDMIDKHRADIITNSWGIYGEPKSYGHFAADEQAFEQAKAEGISVLFSSGDDGDVAAQTGVAQGSWPASSPAVTAVGGTSLAVRDASGAKDEWGWGTYRSGLQDTQETAGGASVTGSSWSPWPPEFLYGAGGGISLHFAQPDYQAGVVPNDLATKVVDAGGNTVATLSRPHRVSPDIAMDADPNTGALYGQTYDVSGDPSVDAGCSPLPDNREYCERRIGGTSLASPLFAGVLALVDQARHEAAQGPLGFANPAMYALGSGSPAIRDVKAPSAPTAVLRNTGEGGPASLRTINSVPASAGGGVIEGADTTLRTTDGWDDVTGLGTPNVPAFITALTGTP